MRHVRPDPEIFQAAWPEGYKPLIPPLAKKVALVIGVGFASYRYSWWVGVVFVAYWALRKIAMWIIHPAASPFKRHNHPAPLGDFVDMKTPDGTQLDTIIYPSDSGLKKAIVFFGGNGMCHGDIADEFNNFIKNYVGDITVLLVNPPGVGRSGGSSSSEALTYAGYTAIEYLISKGYHHNDICVYGWSLGAFPAISGAALIQNKYPATKTPVFVERTFSKLSDFGTILAIFIFILRRNMNNISPLENLRGARYVVSHQNDPVIPRSASLADKCDNSVNKIDIAHDFKVYELLENNTYQAIQDNHCIPLWDDTRTQPQVVQILQQLLDLPPMAQVAAVV